MPSKGRQKGWYRRLIGYPFVSTRRQTNWGTNQLPSTAHTASSSNARTIAKPKGRPQRMRLRPKTRHKALMNLRERKTIAYDLSFSRCDLPGSGLRSALNEFRRFGSGVVAFSNESGLCLCFDMTGCVPGPSRERSCSCCLPPRLIAALRCCKVAMLAVVLLLFPPICLSGGVATPRRCLGWLVSPSACDLAASPTLPVSIRSPELPRRTTFARSSEQGRPSTPF
ncbi:hypothetical protein SAMN05192541_106161 [Bradyrhizobium arachidis]|nr:hypothetical protein SAMN05192541_106161 [Bradyrhizobium arachidis]